jgi:hypothetical protein
VLQDEHRNTGRDRQLRLPDLQRLRVSDEHKPLLDRRVPHDSVVLGRAYVIHARNAGVGVAVIEDGMLGYLIHRVKFGHHYLFTEYDWAENPTYGTAIPLRLLEAEPPTDEDRDKLLVWLAEQQEKHRDEIEDAWRTVLGYTINPKEK